MRTQISKYILITALMLALASTASAKPGGGKGGGGGGKDGGGNDIVPISITFRDDPFYDRVGSDIITPYVDGEYPLDDGTGGIHAFLGSKANSGNVWLKLAKSPRGLYLDFTECFDSPDYSKCTSPFAPLKNGVVSLSAIKLNANDVLTGGVLTMAVGETALSMPMRIYYEFDDGQGPGFIEFNPSIKGGKPCKNKSNFVLVKRTSATSWDIWSTNEGRACVTLPGGSELSGIYLMPFSFTVEIQQ